MFIMVARWKSVFNALNRRAKIKERNWSTPFASPRSAWNSRYTAQSRCLQEEKQAARLRNEKLSACFACWQTSRSFAKNQHTSYYSHPSHHHQPSIFASVQPKTPQTIRPPAKAHYRLSSSQLPRPTHHGALEYKSTNVKQACAFPGAHTTGQITNKKSVAHFSSLEVLQIINYYCLSSGIS